MTDVRPFPALHLTPELPLLLRHLAPRVTVVGDVLLDQWWHGHTDRISREAAAPVVEIDRQERAPGGAGNTAMNLAALGASVDVVGVVGDDEAGRRLREHLESAGVDTSGLQRWPATATVTKTRILGGDQILVRVDEARHTRLTPDVARRLTTDLATALTRADAVVVCDYGSQVLVESVLQAFALGRRPPVVVVDAHDPSVWASLCPDLATPNAAEALALLGRSAPDDRPRAAVFAEAAPELRRLTGADAVVVTLDQEGSMLLTGDGVVHETRTTPVPERQAAGAGDTFVAALTVAVAGGLGLPLGTDLAQAAAEVVVRMPGTSVCGTDDLVEQLSRAGDPVLSADALFRRVTADRAAGKRIVLTNGCFDVLHRGHTTYLSQAAALGDVLIVAVNDDESVRRLKGPERPLNPADDRARVIAALSCVTYVTVFETDTPIPLLEQVRPEIYAKGGDYTPEMLQEAAVVEAYGGEVVILDYVSDHSTTKLVRRMRESAGNSPEPA